jgi:sporulation integral membrane protein YtvI
LERIIGVQKKYKTEIGESMGKPEKKLKRILLIMGITGAVYGTFRYLLPLVVPFLVAWGLAAFLRPTALWLSAHCRVTIYANGKERIWALPVGVAGIGELFVIMGVLFWLLYFGSRALCLEAGMFLDQIPVWVEELDAWLTGMCHWVEDCFCLTPNCLVLLMREMLRGLMESLKQGAMPYLMVNSVTVFRWGMEFTVVSVILLVAVGMILQEMEVWKRRCKGSLFCQEYDLMGRRLTNVANAYLKTQGIIMVLTTLICTAGFWMLGNPYYILAGLGIGILDAFPILGTGTILVPWAIFCFFGKRWGRGLFLLGLYLVCYFLREILEAKLMGNRVGLSSLETLISMYVGLKLFGILGLILGPVGLLLVEDLVEHYDNVY